MKILVISNYRGLHTARPEAEIFIGLKKMGVDITIMTHADAEYIDIFEKRGIKVIPHHPSKKYDRPFIDLVRRELDNGKYDILQLYNNKAIRNGIRAAKNSKVNVVIYRGASANMAWYNPFNYLKFYHPRIDYVICNSEEIRQKFISVPFYKEEKAITILKGHDIEWYKDITPYNIRSELNLKDQDSTLLVTVANNRKVKGIPTLLSALKHLKPETNFNLLLIGEKMGQTIRELIEQSGHKEKVHVLGFRKDALNIVANCDLYICPSTGSEALTKSVIEAMSLGVTPIISDIEGNKPLVNDSVNGFIFKNKNTTDLAEKISTAIRNKHTLPDFSKAAKWKIERDISSHKTIKDYYRFYQKIVQNAKKSD